MGDILSWAALGKGSSADGAETAVGMVWAGLTGGVLGMLPVGFLMRKLSGVDKRVASRALEAFRRGGRKIPKSEWSKPVKPFAGDVMAPLV